MKQIKIKPLSVNECWQGRRFQTPKYKQYHKTLYVLLPKLKYVDFTKRLKLNIVFGFSSAAADLDNPIKPFVDILQAKYKFNDKQIFELNVKKEITKKGNEFITFKIETL